MVFYLMKVRAFFFNSIAEVNCIVLTIMGETLFCILKAAF